MKTSYERLRGPASGVVRDPQADEHARRRPSHNLTRTTRGSVLDELGDKELVKNGAKECRPSHNPTRGSVLDELGDKELVKNGAKECRPSHNLTRTTRGSVLDELGDEDD